MKKTWTYQTINELYELPFLDLLFQAQQVHRQHFAPNEVQLSTLLNIKTGACPEDCAYCPQSGHYKTGVDKQTMLNVNEVLAAAKEAKAQGATRFCMGAAWRSPSARDLPKVTEMIKGVKALGLEACVTLGMLNQDQAAQLKEAELDYYNHNLDSSPDFYKTIITTRTYQDRLDTLQNVRDAGIKVCCGGIVGMGESREDRVNLLLQLSSLAEHPESVPINRLIPIQGTPLEQTENSLFDNFEFIRTIAVTRIVMPKSMVRLSAGRDAMSDEMQAMCFAAGANSIHFGEKLLVTANPETSKDLQLLKKLGIKPQVAAVPSC